MSAPRQVRMVIQRSENGRDNWQPVKPNDVPDWVKDPDNITKLIQGEQCMRPKDGNAGSDWYRGVMTNEDRQSLVAAMERRAQRDSKRRGTMH